MTGHRQLNAWFYYAISLLLGITVTHPADSQGGEKLIVDLSQLCTDGSGEKVGKVSIGKPPQQENFQNLSPNMVALDFGGQGSRVVVPHRTEISLRNGDAFTFSGWVRVDAVQGEHTYIIGKGRTYQKERVENQNYAIRLTRRGSILKPSFLFATSKDVNSSSYHRWIANSGFQDDGEWHFVALAYQFGHPNSLWCVVDGKSVSGKWDMAGATNHSPITSNEPIWIGSSQGGNPSSSLSGSLANLKLSNTLLSPSDFTSTYQPLIQPPKPPTFLLDPNNSSVVVTLHEDVQSHTHFPRPTRIKTPKFNTSLTHAYIHRLPIKYLSGGLRDSWKGPVLMRLFVRTNFARGDTTLLFRTQGKARLWVNGEIVAETQPKRFGLDAHQPFVPYSGPTKSIHAPPSSEQEAICELNFEKETTASVVLEVLVGSQQTRCEPGETLIAASRDGKTFHLLHPFIPGSLNNRVPLLDRPIKDMLQQTEVAMRQIERDTLLATSKQNNAAWNSKHALKRKRILNDVQELADEDNQGLEEVLQALSNEASPSEVARLMADFLNQDFLLNSSSPAVASTRTDWLRFTRRAFYDALGVPPNLMDLDSLSAGTNPPSTERIVDYVFHSSSDSTPPQRNDKRLEFSSRWADNWTGYWQDVLAENPNILKPSLNNSGPFRYFIHDAFRINKPFDRFVHELISMQGDVQAGGPAGFGIATENDVPMAEKAHILASAFLGMDMKCARCHDAPYHPWTQRQLFSIAAMLEEKPIIVPKTSSVPRDFFTEGREPIIEVTLQPGVKVAPQWPFPTLSNDDSEKLIPQGSTKTQLSTQIVEHPRFAKVIVNRVWSRLMGWGLVLSEDDWFESEPRHPKTLDHLSKFFIASGYDLNLLVRSIMLTDIYRRERINPAAIEDESNLSLFPWHQRLTAEQIVDGMHYAAGVKLQTEPVTFDLEANQNRKNFLNLGPAQRAWQLTSLANERDRPSLSLAKAAAVVECLEAFGWRSSRQSPASHRDQEPNMVQPGVLANGAMVSWVSRLTDDSRLTQLAIEAPSVEEFVDTLFLAMLSRKPSTLEKNKFCEALTPGFDTRINQTFEPADNDLYEGYVSWTNHFSVEANLLSQKRLMQTERGPKPSNRIQPNWRVQAEDAIWAVLNAPEFVMAP